jgi:hypothetical protein
MCLLVTGIFHLAQRPPGGSILEVYIRFSFLFKAEEYFTYVHHILFMHWQTPFGYYE